MCNTIQNVRCGMVHGAIRQILLLPFPYTWVHNFLPCLLHTSSCVQETLLTQVLKNTLKRTTCFVNNSLFENQASGCLCVASLAAALLGGQPLVSLLGDGQTDSLSSGQGHPRLVALETEEGENGNLLMLIEENSSCR